ncbi:MULTISPECIES: cation:proton antiporter [unclassified Streptomyces]|uniref:cation:proton antiporter n=1 Tax=unclassified Streptomyces TaxID=2593676 RepID=UPI0038140CB5
MEVLSLWPRFLHAAAALCVLLAVARTGRAAARLLRQPEVIGEVTVGLLAGPTVLALLGRPLFDTLLPAEVLDIIKFVSKAGLVLFLVGLAHHLKDRPIPASRRSMTALTTGAMVLPLITGLLLVGWIEITGDTAARGDAPLPAFTLMVAVAMSITAVPVLARILTDRGMADSEAGRLALASAIVIDGVGWLLFITAISLNSGGLTDVLRSLGTLAAGALCAAVLRFAMRTRAARRLCVRFPAAGAVLLGATALVVALAMEEFGMTAVVGAALVGFAVPGGASGPWSRAATTVSSAGLVLVPTFFVVSGITMLGGISLSVSWALIAWAVVLGCVGKGVGSYVGARLVGRPPIAATRIAVLMNTRGLTELIVIQAGFGAGVLAAPTVLALTVMALVTTAMTGPLLQFLDRADLDTGVEPVPLTTESGAR